MQELVVAAEETDGEPRSPVTEGLNGRAADSPMLENDWAVGARGRAKVGGRERRR